MKLKNIFSVEIRLQKVTRNPCGERSLLSGNFFNYFFQKKLANPGLFLVYFWSFQTNNTVLTTHQCKKCPSSIWCWHLNTHTFRTWAFPITIRPGILPRFDNCWWWGAVRSHLLFFQKIGKSICGSNLE